MSKSFDIQELAEEMKQAQEQVRQMEPFSARYADFDVPAAYEVSRLLHEGRMKEGAKPVGRKIGFTNPEMWSLYGVREPIWAHVYDTTVVHLTDAQTTCRIGKFAEPKIEPEIVLHFKSTPPENAGPADILACIDWIAFGIEIVQSHYPGWKFTAADTIADRSLHATLLVGEHKDVATLGTDLIKRIEEFTIELSCDGAELERGKGSNVLGSPLAAIAHLISVLAKQPDAPPLQAGELVTTGTLTAALPIQPGQTWTTALDGIDLTDLSVRFED